VEQLDTCSDPATMSPDCMLTAVTLQIPFEMVPRNPLLMAPVDLIGTTAITFVENGVVGRSFQLSPMMDAVHVLTNCGDALSSDDGALPCQSLVTHADGSLVSASAPATTGEQLVIYVYGLGATTPAVATGAPSPWGALANTVRIDLDFRPNGRHFPSGVWGGGDVSADVCRPGGGPDRHVPGQLPGSAASREHATLRRRRQLEPHGDHTRLPVLRWGHALRGYTVGRPRPNQPHARPTAQGGIERLQAAGLCFERSAMTLHDQVEGLFLEARDHVYRYLLTLGLYPPQAQEATQDVFLSLYIALQKGGGHPQPTGLGVPRGHNHGLNLREKQDSVRPFEPEMEAALASPGKAPSRR